MVGMTFVRVDGRWSVFMGIVFLDFVGRSRWVDAVEGIEAVRCGHCVLVQMAIVGEGAKVAWVIRLRGGEFCNVGVRFGVCFAFNEVVI